MHVMNKLLVNVHKAHAKNNLQKCLLEECHVSVKSHDLAKGPFPLDPLLPTLNMFSLRA